MVAELAVVRLYSARYAVGSIGTGVFSTVPSVLLLFFCTDVLKLPASIAAAIILIPKLWSIIWDPFVGRISDGALTRWGRRAPFMLVGATGMVMAFVALFAPPMLSQPGLILWTGAAYFLLVGFYSLYAVPYMAVPAEVVGGPEVGARLVAWRMGFVMAGVILGGAAAPMLVGAFGGGRHGYATMALILAVLCLLAMLLSAKGLRPRPLPSYHAVAKPSVIALLRGNRPYLALALAYMLQIAAAAVVSAAMPYIVARVFGRAESDVGVAMLLLLGATLVSVPLWARLARRAPYPALLLALGIYAGGAIVSLTLAALGAQWQIFAASLAFLGLGFGGLQLLPFTLAARFVSSITSESEGALTGVWAAHEKIGLAIGPALLGAVLTYLGEGAIGLLSFTGATAAGLTLLSLVPLAAWRKVAVR